MLVVEDEAIVAIDLEQRLARLGYEVCGLADTCEDAVADVRALQPDLVLMDIHLIGEKDGVDASIEIKKASNIPIVFVTAYEDDATLTRIGSAAPFSYILKPFEERELKAIMDVALYRHQAEGQRAGMERWRGAALSSMGDGVIVIDMDGKVQFINRIAEGMMGWNMTTALGRHVTEVFALEKHGSNVAVTDLLDLALQRGAPVYLDDGHSLKMSDGRMLPVADSIATIRDENNVSAGWVIIFRDVSGLLNAEKTRKRVQEKALEAERRETLGALAGGVANDFNNLLHVITTDASLGRAILDVLGAGARPKELVDLLTDIQGAADKGADLCGQLLVYAGLGHFEVTEIELGAVVRHEIDRLKTAVSKNATLAFDLADEFMVIRADVGKLRQVLRILLTNASESLGGRPGIVTVQTSRFTADSGFFSEWRVGSNLAAGQYILLKVSDTGCGMTPEVAERIFDPFFTTKFTGRGLSLAATMGIMRAFGGGMRVASTPGEGTDFHLAFPVLGGESFRPTRQDTNQNKLGAPSPVLVVDDDPGVRTACCRLLQHLGFDVESAAGGLEALSMVQGNRGNYGFVCMDAEMPQMSGIDAFKAIRAEFPSLPVIIMSGYTAQVKDGSSGGPLPNAFLRKPFSKQELTDVLRRIAVSMPPARHLP